jgi:hypothetical protein
MNCFELQESLIEISDGSAAAQQVHLKTCPRCSALVADLNLIASTAHGLRSIAEPSPRVWNSIEIALRQEGLIHPPRTGRALLPSFHTPAWIRWMVPVAAALLITVGVYLRNHSLVRQIEPDREASVVRSAQPDVQLAGLNDDDLKQELAQLSPALQAQYSDNLRRVNEYIQDEQRIVSADPNDEEAHRSLMEAYQQKAMLFELALDRSLQ